MCSPSRATTMRAARARPKTCVSVANHSGPDVASRPTSGAVLSTVNDSHAVQSVGSRLRSDRTSMRTGMAVEQRLARSAGTQDTLRGRAAAVDIVRCDALVDGYAQRLLRQQPGIFDSGRIRRLE